MIFYSFSLAEWTTSWHPNVFATRMWQLDTISWRPFTKMFRFSYLGYGNPKIRIIVSCFFYQMMYPPVSSNVASGKLSFLAGNIINMGSPIAMFHEARGYQHFFLTCFDRFFPFWPRSHGVCWPMAEQVGRSIGSCCISCEKKGPFPVFAGAGWASKATNWSEERWMPSSWFVRWVHCFNIK